MGVYCFVTDQLANEVPLQPVLYVTVIVPEPELADENLPLMATATLGFVSATVSQLNALSVMRMGVVGVTVYVEEQLPIPENAMTATAEFATVSVIRPLVPAEPVQDPSIDPVVGVGVAVVWVGLLELLLGLVEPPPQEMAAITARQNEPFRIMAPPRD